MTDTPDGYQGMVQLHEQFNQDGFQVLAFPCNQFGSQEPNSNAVIEAFAGTKALDFGTESDTCGGASCVGRSGRPAAHGDRGAVCTGGASGCPFPMFAKSTVNSPMCTSNPNVGCTPSSTECCTFNNQVYNYLKAELPGAVPWNFAKFLVDKNGNVVKRWVSVTEPPEMIPFIEAAIAGTPMPGGGH